MAKLAGLAPAGPLPPLDDRAVREAHEQVRAGVRAGTLNSAHDIAEGGLAVALAECCIAGDVGASVTLRDGVDGAGLAGIGAAGKSHLGADVGGELSRCGGTDEKPHIVKAAHVFKG